MQPKISVIIPVYNVEKYLPECIESILNQTFQDFEIICVDDGSTDRSLDILQEYKRKDDRFVNNLQFQNLTSCNDVAFGHISKICAQKIVVEGESG